MRVQVKAKLPGCMPFFLRFFWMIGGAVILIICFIAISINKVLAISTVLFWLVVLEMIIARLLDIAWFEGQTPKGKQATILNWVQYMSHLLLLAAVVYAIARIVAYFRLL